MSTFNNIFHTQNHLSQNNPLFFNCEPIVTLKQSSNQAVKSLSQSNPLYSHSESVSQYDILRVLINELNSVIVSFSYSSEDHELLSDKKRVFYRKPILELKEKIYNVYYECQTENWDGYEAEPIRYLFQSLQFADVLFSESRMLIESVDIIPENDGCLCFEWFKSDNKFISISVKNDKLIYNYKIGDEEGCGETTFSGQKILIEQIKKVA